MKTKNTLKSGDYSSSFNQFVFDSVNKNSTCLDVGCWNGNLGHALIKEKKCTVDGIDFNDKVLKEAKKNGYTETFSANLNAPDLDFSMIKKKYDHIIFADVLEHLINPSLILEMLGKDIKKDGIVIVSLPNVAFLENRIRLLLGQWNYREFGTLDKTHLRFYTLKTAKKLLEDAGYTVISIDTYNQFKKLKFFEIFRKIFPAMFGYQILVKAKLK